MPNFNLPPGVTDADIDALSGPDPADIPTEVLSLAEQIHKASEYLRHLCNTLIAIEDVPLGELYASERAPDPITWPDVEARLQAFYDEKRDAEAEYLRDEATERRYED